MVRSSLTTRPSSPFVQKSSSAQKHQNAQIGNMFKEIENTRKNNTATSHYSNSNMNMKKVQKSAKFRDIHDINQTEDDLHQTREELLAAKKELKSKQAKIRILNGKIRRLDNRAFL